MCFVFHFSYGLRCCGFLFLVTYSTFLLKIMIAAIVVLHCEAARKGDVVLLVEEVWAAIGCVQL